MFNICLYLYIIVLNGISIGNLALIYLMQQYQRITLQKTGLSSCSLLLTKPYILGSVEFGDGPADISARSWDFTLFYDMGMASVFPELSHH